MKYKNILITGKSGTVGSNLDFGRGFSSHDYDLRNPEHANKVVSDYNPDAIINAASRVGGLNYHLKNKYSIFYGNNLINSNIIEAAKNAKIQRVVSFLSSCIYSEKCESPYNETQLFEHEPFSVHLPYGHSKRFLEIQSRLCYEEFGLKYNCIIPTNIYGMNDDFSIENGHVVGVLIHKAYLAAKNGTDFSVWGDGTQQRQFLFAEDICKITKWVLEEYEEKGPLVISDNKLVSVGYLAYLIAKEFNIENKIVFDTSKPSGQLVRNLDGSKFKDLNDFKFTSIEDGIKKTTEWFKREYPKVRK